jgi:membrane protein YqaA with SNARE-associated domain
VVNWLLGRYCLRWQDRKWFPIKSDSLKHATAWFQRYGVWSILFAWAPIIGDPLTFIAGALRMNFWLFVLLAGLGKAARYAVVAGVVRAAF